MPQFLTLKPPFIALDELLSNIPDIQPENEEINTMDSLGRVLANDFYAPHPLPEFPRSTVDGYAVRSFDTHGSSDSIPAILKMVGECPMGKKPEMTLDGLQAVLIHTGGMIPSGADSVVMLENSHLNPGNDLEVYKAVSQNENVLLLGEDVIKGGKVGAGDLASPTRQQDAPTGSGLKHATVGSLAHMPVTSARGIHHKCFVQLLSGNQMQKTALGRRRATDVSKAHKQHLDRGGGHHGPDNRDRASLARRHTTRASSWASSARRWRVETARWRPSSSSWRRGVIRSIAVATA